MITWEYPYNNNNCFAALFRTTLVNQQQKKTCHFCIQRPLHGCWNSPILVSHCMTTNRLAAARLMKTWEANVPPQDFMLGGLPVAMLPIYPRLKSAHNMLDCVLQGLVAEKTCDEYANMTHTKKYLTKLETIGLSSKISIINGKAVTVWCIIGRLSDV